MKLRRLLAGALAAVLTVATPAYAAQQVINVGSGANDGTGDTLRAAFQKAVANFAELYTQAFDPELSAISGLTSAANKVPYFTGSGTAALADFTAAGRALVDDADNTAQRTTLGLAIGTNVQAYDPDLTTYAGITPSANVQTILGGANYAAIRTSLSLVPGTDVQAYDADLSTYAGITPSANVQTLLGAANYSAFKSSLGLGTFADQNYATPPAIGGTTPAAGSFSALTATGTTTLNVTGSTQCLHVNTSGVVSGTGSDCGAGGGGGITALTGDVTASGSGSVAATLATPLTPGGRLTLTSNTPVMTADATAQGTVYYAPYVNARLPIYDGSVWAMKAFAQLSLTLNSTDNVSGSLYDIFAFDNSGTLTLGTGPAWVNTATVTMTIASPAVVTWTGHGLSEGAPVVFTTSGALPTGITAGTTYYVGRSPGANTFNIATSVANAAAGTFVNTSGSQSGTHTATNPTTLRGSGAGTTELELKDGVWTNKNSITLKAGGSTVGTPGANRAVYLGTVYMTDNGQTGMAIKPSPVTGGNNNILGVYNAYNRVAIKARSGDATAGTWTYSTVAWRRTNNSGSNRISWIDGLQQSSVAVTNRQMGFPGTSSALAIGTVFDSTTNAPDDAAQSNVANANVAISVTSVSPPLLGLHYAQGMETACTAVTATWTGAETSPTRQQNSLTLLVEM